LAKVTPSLDIAFLMVNLTAFFSSFVSRILMAFQSFYANVY
jgi:hypothetical protein